MFIKNKKHYRLYELERVCTISHYDYLYYAEQYKDSINVYVHHLPILITNDSWEAKTYCASGIYSGLIRLNRKDKFKFIRDKTIEINKFQLEDKYAIKSFSTEPPFKIDSDNGVINEWESCLFENLMETGLQACVYPNLNHIDYDVFKEMETLFGDITHFRPKKITENTIPISFDDICVMPEQAEWIAQLIPTLEQAENTPDISVDITDNFNMFQRYIEFLINTFPQLGGAALFKKLYIEFEKDNDEIDPYCLLIEVSATELVWKNEKGIEKSVKKRSFETEVSKIKNKIVS